MIISKSNTFSGNTVTVQAGTLSSGVIANVLNNNFAKNIVSSSATLTIRLVGITSSQYVGLHGLSLPIGTSITITATGFTKSFSTTKSTKNLVFYNSTPSVFGTTDITFSGSGQKVISYIQGGLASVIDWGVGAGQPFYYLANNIKNRVTTNEKGMPVSYKRETTSPRLSLTMKNMLKTWVRTDLQQIIEHFNRTGILSILDYEADNLPDESVCGFDLQTFAPKAHNETTKLTDVTMSLRVVA